LCEELGAHYLTRPDNAHAKAGNINEALTRTCGEFIAIFDADQAPLPEYLDKTLGYNADHSAGQNIERIMLGPWDLHGANDRRRRRETPSDLPMGRASCCRRRGRQVCRGRRVVSDDRRGYRAFSRADLSRIPKMTRLQN